MQRGVNQDRFFRRVDIVTLKPVYQPGELVRQCPGSLFQIDHRGIEPYPHFTMRSFHAPSFCRFLNDGSRQHITVGHLVDKVHALGIDHLGSD